MSLKFRAPALLALSTVGVLGLCPTAFATPVEANFDCQAKTVIGNKTAEQKIDIDVDAPATVAARTEFDVVATSKQFAVPSAVSGIDLKHIDDFALKLPVPAHSTYLDITLVGGSGFEGTARVTLDAEKTIATIAVPGPIKAGTTVTLPKVVLRLLSGDAGVITSTLHGTSYTDPGLSFKATASTILGEHTSPVSCYPKPNPVLSTTTIS